MYGELYEECWFLDQVRYFEACVDMKHSVWNIHADNTRLNNYITDYGNNCMGNKKEKRNIDFLMRPSLHLFMTWILSLSHLPPPSPLICNFVKFTEQLVLNDYTWNQSPSILSGFQWSLSMMMMRVKEGELHERHTDCTAIGVFSFKKWI